MELVSSEGLRLDGRKGDELRRIECKLGIFSQPDGSAYLEQGNTKVLAAVYGPHQTRGRIKPLLDKAVINCQYSMAVFSTGERRRKPRGDRGTQEMSIRLRQTLMAAIKTETYPKSQIDVYIEVLQADGGNFSCAVNAATLALIDAGIPLNDFVISCTASIYNNDVALVDVNHLEESMGGSTLIMAVLPLTENIALMGLSQRFHMDHLEKIVNAAMKGCKQIRDILETAVRNHSEFVASCNGLEGAADTTFS